MKLKYELTKDQKGHLGYIVADAEAAIGSVKIPKTHNRLPVVAIKDQAFQCCNRLTSISLPESITSIGSCAFDGCSGLTSINIPDSVTNIGVSAFSFCSGLTSVAIGSGVTDIRRSAFNSCYNLTSVVIPNSVGYIGAWAFMHCSGLTKRLPIGTKKAKLVKAFNSNLTCRGFRFVVGKTYDIYNPKLCERGFHACAAGVDLFNYYDGADNKDVVFYEVELSGITDERRDDSKVVGSTIKLLRKLTIAEAANYVCETLKCEATM